ncbi:DoxX family protein [Phycicoccus sp. BSK3Z-2]|uniref:DoxX family protein n=2 Tax=Phycicoccus avicenniae TaxID=2828860 RepID=A0A941D954_9MICO|nr:DoxX family protein [Phycicoccus avicenniae]
MLASMFVVGGVDQLKKPAAKSGVARPVVEKVAPLLRLPEDTELLVRANGVVMVGAGTMLALGKMPRVSAVLLAATLVPTTVAAHRFWEEEDPDTRAMQKIQFLKNLGMLGGVLLAAVDTEGRPGLAYRAHLASESAQRTARTTRRETRHAVRTATTEARLKAAQGRHAFS